MFRTTFYAVGIFVDVTNSYQLTKSINLQTNFCFTPKATISSSNVIRYIEKFNNQCEIK